MQKTLEEYINEAEYYLGGVTAEIEKEYKSNLISFCKDKRLTEGFNRLVKTNPKWHDLATQEKVRYFVDTPIYYDSYGRKKVVYGVKPKVDLMIFDRKVPVIKVTAPGNILEGYR